MIFPGIEWQISHFSDPDGEISFLRRVCECSWLPGDHEETRSGIKWDPWWSSKCHVPTWPLNQTYWSASLLAVQTHVEARSTQRGRGLTGRWGRWAGLRRCFEVNVWRKVWGKRLWCFSAVVSMYIANIMCEEVNNSTWLQHGSCLFALCFALQWNSVKTSVNSSACCMYKRDDTHMQIAIDIFVVDQ